MEVGIHERHKFRALENFRHETAMNYQEIFLIFLCLKFLVVKFLKDFEST
jgi:hypothetical protein